MDEEQIKPVLKVLRSVVLSISSSRVPPRVLLKPPVEVTVHSSFQVLTPIQYMETFLGEKPVVETRYSSVVYLREKASNTLFRTMETTITLMHIIEPDEGLQSVISMPPDKLPRGITMQLMSVTMQEAIPILVMLFDKHMVPMVLPINIRVECNDREGGREE